MFIPLGPEVEDLTDASVDRPYVTYVLLGLCILVFLASSFFRPREGWQRLEWNRRWGYCADSKFGVGLITHQFLHADFWHLLGNGIFLFAFGSAVERKQGHVAVAVVYLVSGATGAWFFGAFDAPVRLPNGWRGYRPLIGASGSISGLIGCLIPLAPRLRIRVLFWLYHYVRIIPIKGWIVSLIYVGKELLWAVFSHSVSDVAYTAHVGGALGGAVVGALILPQLERLRSTVSAPDAGQAAMGVGAPTRKVELSKAGFPRAARPQAAGAIPDEVASSGSEETPWAERDEIGASLADIGIAGLGSGSSGSGSIKAPPPVRRTARSAAAAAALQSAEVRITSPSGTEIAPVVETDLGAVPTTQDLSQVSGVWAHSYAEAELQQRFQLARKAEKRADKAGKAVRFYISVLNNRRFPAGHRAYAGTRLCRVLCRAGYFGKTLEIAEKLLANRLPPELEHHIRDSARFARKQLQRRAS